MEKLFRQPDYYHSLIDLSLDTLKEKYDHAASARTSFSTVYLYQQKKCFGPGLQ